MGDLRVVPVRRAAQAGTVLRIVDAHSGRYSEIDPGHRRPLRIRAHPPQAGDAQHLPSLECEPGLPDGSTFETVAHLDHVLGLDVTRQVGRPRPPGSGT